MKFSLAVVFTLSTIFSAQAYECVKVKDAEIIQPHSVMLEPTVRDAVYELRNKKGEVVDENSTYGGCIRDAISCEKVTIHTGEWTPMTVKSEPREIIHTHYRIIDVDGKVLKDNIDGLGQWFTCQSEKSKIIKKLLNKK